MPAQPTPASCRQAWRALCLVALSGLATVLVAATPAFASPASYKGSSADGSVVFFETEDQLVPGDTDTKRDVYERFYDAEAGVESYVTRQVSIGPTGGNDAYNATFEKTNTEGTIVFFSTGEQLVEADTDHRSDVYARDLEAGTTTLVTVGEAACLPDCGNGSFDAGFARAAADGSEVFFVTQEQMTAGDTDSSPDVYVRYLASEATELVSAGGATCAPACGNGAFNDVALRGISADGSHAYFTTAEKLSGFDTDTAADIYSRDLGAGTTTLVSRGGEECAPGCGNGGGVPVFLGSSEGGTRVFFNTAEAMVEGDVDTATDVYARDLPAGPTIMISDGSSSTETASFAAATPDGAHVFFTTAEALLSEDEDSANDIYEWTGGNLALITSAECSSACSANFDAVSADAGTVLFSTAEQLVAEDEDSSLDIYSQAVGGGEPRLISRGTGCGGCGNGAADARFDRASADAERAVFSSPEVLAADDTDSEDDIYARDVPGEETTLVTTSPSYCPLKKGNCGATFVDTSAAGDRVFFTTVERFTLEDGDNEVDVYERFLGAIPAENVTRLVSTGNDPNLELGPPPPVLEGTTPESPGGSTSPKVYGGSKVGSTVKLYANSSCTGEPLAHGSAAEFGSPGIAVSVSAGQTVQIWATAEAEGFVSLCAGPISYTQESAGSGGGGEEGGGGASGGGGSSGGGSTGGTTTIAPAQTPNGAVHVMPHTHITSAPSAKTRRRNPVLRFTDITGQAGTHFRCKVDRHRWRHCRSPLRLKKLGRGRHVVKVKAVNAVGMREAHPAVRRFKVVAR